MTTAIAARGSLMNPKAESAVLRRRRPAKTADFEIAVIVLASAWRRARPSVLNRVRRAALATLDGVELPFQMHSLAPIELAIVLADDAMVRRLNREYRGIDKPTNVLSFGADAGGRSLAQDAPVLLGDVVLAYGTVAAEASTQRKAMSDHASHLVVHGILHLLGHDHQTSREARAMETIETDVLFRLGITDPHRSSSARRVGMSRT